MKNNKTFYSKIWKINSIIILVVGILGLLVLAYASYKIYQDTFYKTEVSNVINITQIKSKPIYKLDNNSRLINDKYLLSPLLSKQEYRQNYYTKDTNSTCNIWFINTKDSSSTWLFPNNNKLIIQTYVLSKNRFDTNIKDARAILYEVITKDSNDDKRLSFNDNKSLYINTIAGLNKKILVDDISQLKSWQLIDKNTVFILYIKNKKILSSKINLENFILFYKKAYKIW